MRRRYLITIIYWLISVLLIALIFCSLKYSLPEAFLYSTLFLPGALGLKYCSSKILRETNRHKLIWNSIFVVIAITSFEYAVIIFTSGMFANSRELCRDELDIPSMMLNPVFILMILYILITGDYLLTNHLKITAQDLEKPLTFISDRMKVSVFQSDITFIESNDTEVWINLRDGRKFRNKTPISRWQDVLGDPFLRIHRSYLVNKTDILSVSNSKVILGNVSLPISGKYREQVIMYFDEKC